jgi:hypothetical protein
MGERCFRDEDSSLTEPQNFTTKPYLWSSSESPKNTNLPLFEPLATALRLRGSEGAVMGAGNAVASSSFSDCRQRFR